MTKEKQILNIVKKNKGTITTKEVNDNNIPRIYLTKLIKEKKLFRVDRGVYSTVNQKVNSFYTLQVQSDKTIFSHFTSLEIQGFYKNIDKQVQISVPQSYNAKKYTDYKVFYNSKKNFGHGIIEVDYNGYKLKVYDIERTVCDIIKDRNRFDQMEYYKFINYYFSIDHLNYKKLLEYSLELKISELVHHYLAILKA